MTWKTLIKEATTAARASLVSSILVALVVAATCFAAIATVGRQAALEANLARTLAGPAARTLTLTDTNNSARLTPAVLDSVASLNAAQAAIGIGSPLDVVNGALGPESPKVALATLAGSWDQAVTLVRGRLPVPGAAEVVVSRQMQTDLGLAEPVGFLQSTEGSQWAIVGSFEARAPFDDLTSLALSRVDSATSTEAFRQMMVVATSTSTAGVIQNAALAVVNPAPDDLSVLSPVAAANASQQVANQLSGFGRSYLLLILGVGGFFVAVVVLSDVLIRRRDLGRRRTLGISRGDLVILVALRTAVPAVLGAVVGTMAALVVGNLSHAMAPPSFAGASALLASLAAVVASLSPAAYASLRDPVAVMRTA